MLNRLLQSPEKRLLTTLRVLTIFFVVGLFMSSDVWNCSIERTFPMLPIVDGLNGLPACLLTVVFGILLVLGSIMGSRWFLFPALGILLLLLLQDQMRWQPWVYLYFCMLLLYLFPRERQVQMLPYLQVLIIGVYFWSGFYKLNPGFVEGTFDYMLHDLFFIEDTATRQSLHWLGYSIPIIEMLLAILLIIPRFRNYAVFGVILTHIIILTYLIQANHNSIVYPWNLAMIGFVVFLFYRNKAPLFDRTSFDLRKQWLTAVGAFFFLFMPFMNLFGLWDNYLSFRLYSGNNGLYCVGIDQSEVILGDRQPYPFWMVDEPRGKYWVYVNKWAIDDLNVPFYPEMRTFEQVCAPFCDAYGPEHLEFVKFQTDFVREGAVIFTCDDCRE